MGAVANEEGQGYAVLGFQVAPMGAEARGQLGLGQVQTGQQGGVAEEIGGRGTGLCA